MKKFLLTIAIAENGAMFSNVVDEGETAIDAFKNFLKAIEEAGDKHPERRRSVYEGSVLINAWEVTEEQAEEFE